MKMEEQIFGSMLPDPHEIIDGAKRSIHDIADPLGLFDSEASTPAQRRQLTEVMDDMQRAVSKGQFNVAEALIKEGRDTTNCSWCQQKLSRTEIDVKYADGVCRVGTKEECEAGASVVAKKIEDAATVLKLSAKAAENRENGIENHD
jgi:hypothetical protein